MPYFGPPTTNKLSDTGQLGTAKEISLQNRKQNSSSVGDTSSFRSFITSLSMSSIVSTMDDNSNKMKKMYQPSKLGRKGDPRMHAAVKARFENSDLSPLEALQKGGFTFYTAEDGNLYDADNVSVSQRKNQLSRRLRLQKKQVDVEDECDEVDRVRRAMPSGSGREEVHDDFDDISSSTSSSKNKKRNKLAHSNSKVNGMAHTRTNTSTLVVSSGPNDNVNSEFPEASSSLVAAQTEMHDMINFNANASRDARSRLLSSFDLTAGTVQDPRYGLALDNFRSDVASLLKKSMINAGFKNSETDECDIAYISFAQNALDEERERIERIRKRMHPEPVEKNHFGDDSHSHAHSHSHSHSIAHSHSQPSQEKECMHSRHLHRLEGICGHQAIVHKPPGRQPHIDFLVNDKVECYEGCNPMMDSEAFWPSNFSANETAGMFKKNLELDDCNSNMLTEHQKQVLHLQQQSQRSLIQHQQKQKQCCEGVNCKPPAKDPKVFDLRDIDFDNGEWSQIGSKLDDLFESVDKEEDEKLLGSLFSLKQNGV